MSDQDPTAEVNPFFFVLTAFLLVILLGGVIYVTCKWWHEIQVEQAVPQEPRPKAQPRAPDDFFDQEDQELRFDGSELHADDLEQLEMMSQISKALQASSNPGASGGLVSADLERASGGLRAEPLPSVLEQGRLTGVVIEDDDVSLL